MPEKGRKKEPVLPAKQSPFVTVEVTAQARKKRGKELP